MPIYRAKKYCNIRQLQNMIQSNEIRINNLLYYKLGTPCTKIVRVKSVSTETISMNDLTTHAALNMFEPIPITRGSLLWFGFAMVEGAQHVYMNLTEPRSGYDFEIYLKLYEHPNSTILERVRVFTGMQFLEIKIEHIHELQNLFYTLTGVEMEINNTNP